MYRSTAVAIRIPKRATPGGHKHSRPPHNKLPTPRKLEPVPRYFWKPSVNYRNRQSTSSTIIATRRPWRGLLLAPAAQPRFNATTCKTDLVMLETSLTHCPAIPGILLASRTHNDKTFVLDWTQAEMSVGPFSTARADPTNSWWSQKLDFQNIIVILTRNSSGDEIPERDFYCMVNNKIKHCELDTVRVG